MSQERGEGEQGTGGGAPKGAVRPEMPPPADGLDGLTNSPAAIFKIQLPNFEGPLDLLLHLIREHKVDILDIPIALITEKYVAALEAMRQMDLDIAGEFILMAATLAHIKSRMLLPDPEPVPEEQQEQGDPRAELVRRLLTYQKYKVAAEELGRQDLLDRDVFTRKVQVDPVPLNDGEVGLVEVSVFKLVEALDRVLKSMKVSVPHQVFFDRVSISDAITVLIERMKVEPKLSFIGILEGAKERHRIIVTFLALLEMCKLGFIRIHQEVQDGDILVSVKNPEALSATAEVKDDYK